MRGCPAVRNGKAAFNISSSRTLGMWRFLYFICLFYFFNLDGFRVLAVLSGIGASLTVARTRYGFPFIDFLLSTHCAGLRLKVSKPRKVRSLDSCSVYPKEEMYKRNARINLSLPVGSLRSPILAYP